ncbi:mucoidy inhibitor MuiA family protein [bacterium]|nr:mucoidy inhibitor MuiA family protein [bacterium]
MFNEVRLMGNNMIAVNGVGSLNFAKDMKAMEQGHAKVQAGGTAATFVIERPSDILTDNKPAQVTVMRSSFPAYFRHTCVPKLSPFVYLKTKATNKTEFTFLPGPTAVFLDGAFVAQANLDLVPSGQEFWTYLGVDQGVSVERKVLARREETSGVFGKKTLRTVFDQVFKLKNGKATDIELVLWDQVPASNHEDIKVVFEEPRYEKDTDDLKMNESKFLEWRLPLKAGAKQDQVFHGSGVPAQLGQVGQALAASIVAVGADSHSDHRWCAAALLAEQAGKVFGHMTALGDPLAVRAGRAVQHQVAHPG